MVPRGSLLFSTRGNPAHDAISITAVKFSIVLNLVVLNLSATGWVLLGLFSYESLLLRFAIIPKYDFIFSKWGPFTVAVIFCPPNAERKQSTLPSPPSATGIEITLQLGNCFVISADMISQICVEERVPLNESGMRITLFMNGTLSTFI